VLILATAYSRGQGRVYKAREQAQCFQCHRRGASSGASRARCEPADSPRVNHQVGLLLHYDFTWLNYVRRAIQGLWEAVEQRQARGGFARVAQSSIDLGDIKTLVNTISSLLEIFQVCCIDICCANVVLTSYSSKVASPLRNGWVCSLRCVLGDSLSHKSITSTRAALPSQGASGEAGLSDILNTHCPIDSHIRYQEKIINTIKSGQ